MSEESEDFLTTRLGDIVTIENNNLNSQEEAVPWICWGRGGIRPPLSKLNLERCLEISGRNKSKTTTKMQIKGNSMKLPTSQNNGDVIMENITTECCSVLGNASTDKHIADWLKQSFSEATESKSNQYTKEDFQKSLCTSYNFPIGTNKNITQLINNDPERDAADKIENKVEVNNDALYKSNQANNTNVEEESTVSQFCLLKQKTTDRKHNSMLFHTSSQISCSSTDKENISKPPPGLTSFDKRKIKCVPNRSQSFTIENLPNNITQNDLKQVLSSFGKVENILIRESEGNVTASIRMGAECNCLWIVECLNGSQPFGGSNA